MLSWYKKLTFQSIQHAQLKIPFKDTKKQLFQTKEHVLLKFLSAGAIKIKASLGLLCKCWLSAIRSKLNFTEQHSFLNHLQSLFLEDYFFKNKNKTTTSTKINQSEFFLHSSSPIIMSETKLSSSLQFTCWDFSNTPWHLSTSYCSFGVALMSSYPLSLHEVNSTQKVIPMISANRHYYQ